MRPFASSIAFACRLGGYRVTYCDANRHPLVSLWGVYYAHTTIAALEADNAALLSALSSTRLELDLLDDEGIKAGAALVRTLSDPHPGAALLEEHRKALVRARNEGLEALAKDLMLRADVATEYGHIKISEVWRNAASIARAMKQPE